MCVRLLTVSDAVWVHVHTYIRILIHVHTDRWTHRHMGWADTGADTGDSIPLNIFFL